MCWYSLFIGNKQTPNSRSAQALSLRKYISSSLPNISSVSHQCLCLCWLSSRSGPCECGFSFHPSWLTSTLWITRALRRFTGSTHIWGTHVFSSGRGLIQRDWSGPAGAGCVFVISAERLWMIGVSDTACFSLGRSSQTGQTGRTKVRENDPQLSSVYHQRTPTYTARITRHKHAHTCCVWERGGGGFLWN